jgi:type I restriction enzyme S subunit
VDSLQYFNKQIFSENTTTYKIVTRGQFVYATNHVEEGSIGYQDLCDAALVSPMYTVFEPDAAIINHQFLYMLLKTEAMRRVFEATTHSSVDRRGSLRWPEFAKLKINIPPMPEQERIVEVLTTASGAVDLAKQQLDELKTQKRALMQKLLSGEWRLPESPAQVKSSSKKGLRPTTAVRKQLSKQ